MDTLQYVTDKYFKKAMKYIYCCFKYNTRNGKKKFIAKIKWPQYNVYNNINAEHDLLIFKMRLIKETNASFIKFDDEAFDLF